jgi:ATP-dependent helicase/nuclease subunit A
MPDSAVAKLPLLTPTQQRVVAARGNLLVMAGAGTGKTKTLVERCLDCLDRDGASLDELLVVTFTEAAAAEMRERLRRAIESRAQAEVGDAGRWAEQLARFDLAHIGTLHSFCLKLVREHFYELGLDPRLALLDEGEARQLAQELLEEQFAAHYAGKHEFSLAVQNLIQIHGGGRDEAIRKLVLQLHHYSQARPDAARWLAQQREKFAAARPADWQRWLPETIDQWRQEWLPVLEVLQSGNEKAAELLRILSRLGPSATGAGWRATAAEVLDQVVSAGTQWPPRRKTLLRKPLEGIFEEAQFLLSLAAIKNDHDPLVEDWSWVRGEMETLLRLAGEFAAALAERKRTSGVLDFHDLEQFALQLLWDFSTGQPTAVAANWRAKLKFVFVDEYQDINAAQDKIIHGLSREGPEANRFLVGDVKQSIYRFRLADPKIFRDYARSWQGAAGQTIPLSENFRSHPALLQLVNSLFRLVMREEVGGVAYDADAELKFGGAPTRGEAGATPDLGPRAELLLRFKNARAEAHGDEDGPLAALDDMQREARLVAWRLKQFVAGQHLVFDADAKVLRPVKWCDVAILLRSPRGRSEIFAKEFERAGVPLAVARGGFYESAEILDLLSLLRLLDNPLQDLPCIAVLRSPLVGLSLHELAEIRLAAREKHFWTALNHSVERRTLPAPTLAKLSVFLERFASWRRLAKLASLSQCLDEVLAETYYADWLRAQSRGQQRTANVAGLLHLAQQFDEFQRQGLFRFLKFVEAQEAAEAEPEVPAVVTENAVRLMSLHQSKGLEFPVVVLADLAKGFNERDLRGDIMFDEEFGLCPKIKPPHLGRRYPSLPHWLAQRRQKRELRGEELRLLYVGLTRARDYLFLTASVSEKNWEQKWLAPQPVTAQKIVAAKSFADWLALWFSNQNPRANATGDAQGGLAALRWQVVSDAESESAVAAPTAPSPAANGPSAMGDEAEFKQLRDRLEWSYPFAAATQRKGKSSVTELRREAEELDDEAEMVFPAARVRPLPRQKPARVSKLNAAEIGAAHHKFLQHFTLAATGDFAAEAGRLARENYLSADEHAALDLEALAAFWNSPLGRKIQAQSEAVRRELPFTARFSPLEVSTIIGSAAEAGLEQEFIIVQGVADLVVLRADDIWLVDFKTDEMSERELPEKIKIYSPQLQLYASALEKIFGRKVTLRALHFLALRRTVEI